MAPRRLRPPPRRDVIDKIRAAACEVLLEYAYGMPVPTLTKLRRRAAQAAPDSTPEEREIATGRAVAMLAAVRQMEGKAFPYA